MSLDFLTKPDLSGLGPSEIRLATMLLRRFKEELADYAKKSEVKDHIGGENVGYIPIAETRMKLPGLGYLSSSNQIINPNWTFWLPPGIPKNWDAVGGAGITEKPTEGVGSTDTAECSRASSAEARVIRQLYGDGSNLSGLSARAQINLKRISTNSATANVRMRAIDSSWTTLQTWNGNTTSATSFTNSDTGSQVLPSGTVRVEISAVINTNLIVFQADDASLIVDGVERIQNGGFETWETDYQAPPWIALENAALTRSTDAYIYNFAAQYSADPASDEAVYQTRNLVKDVGGATYSFAGRIKRISGTGSSWLKLVALDAAGVVLESVSTGAVETDFYQLVYFDNFTLPETTTQLKLALCASDSTSVFVADTISLNPGPIHNDQAVAPDPPIGSADIWMFPEHALPPGWYLANGQVVFGIQTEDLRDTFLYGAGTEALGVRGGSAQADVTTSAPTGTTAVTLTGSDVSSTSHTHTATVPTLPPYVRVNFKVWIGG